MSDLLKLSSMLLSFKSYNIPKRERLEGRVVTKISSQMEHVATQINSPMTTLAVIFLQAQRHWHFPC